MYCRCWKLKTTDCIEAFAIEGCPVGKPMDPPTVEPIHRLGMYAFWVWANVASAFRTSAWAARTPVLFRCARSTTVANETWAESIAGAAASATPMNLESQAARDMFLNVKCRFPFKTSVQELVCSRVR